MRSSLAKRAGQQRGWEAIEVLTTTGQVVTKMVKQHLATWHLASGIRPEDWSESWLDELEEPNHVRQRFTIGY